jgi:hypothetical protein
MIPNQKMARAIKQMDESKEDAWKVSRHLLYEYATEECNLQPGDSMLEARGALSFATQSLSFTLTPGLRALVMTTTTSLAEDTRLLHFTIELLQRNLKRTSRTDNDLAHANYQRDPPLFA